jgi:uncharacterized membrane protein YqiK
MFFDHLTIAGIIVVSLYGLLPVLFGKEFYRVDAEDESNVESITSLGSHKTRQQHELSSSYPDC